MDGDEGDGCDLDSISDEVSDVDMEEEEDDDGGMKFETCAIRNVA